jgi:hypothetical protein
LVRGHPHVPRDVAVSLNCLFFTRLTAMFIPHEKTVDIVRLIALLIIIVILTAVNPHELAPCPEVND